MDIKKLVRDQQSVQNRILKYNEDNAEAFTTGAREPMSTLHLTEARIESWEKIQADVLLRKSARTKLTPAEAQACRLC